MNSSVIAEQGSGTLTRFIWRDPSGGRGIMQVGLKDESTIVLTGPCRGLCIGDVVEFTGKKTHHPTHGLQIRLKEAPRVLKKSDQAEAPQPEVNDDDVPVDAVIKGIVFSSSETGYTVCRINDRKLGENVTLVGKLPTAQEGMQVSGMARWQHDARFGRQLVPTSRTHIAPPSSREGLISYMSSSAIRGIGPKTAGLIFDAYGTDSLRMLREHPERVARDIRGIGKKVAVTLQEDAQAGAEVEAVMAWLLEHNIQGSIATKIVRVYENRAMEVLQSNPWLLCEVGGIGFLKADEVAQSMGLGGLRQDRAAAAILFALDEQSNQGHTGVYRDQLSGAVAELLKEQTGEAYDQCFDGAFSELLSAQKIAVCKREEGGEDFVQRAFFAIWESESARLIKKIAENGPAWDSKKAIAAIPEVEREMGIKLSDDQREAVWSVLSSGFSLLVGGPGRGKTTVTGVILGAVKKARPSIQMRLGSPTGKAAMRLSESTSIQASTIHRMLEWGGDGKPQRNADRPLEGDLFVFDEVSMTDSRMLYNVLKGLPEGAAVLKIGDRDQLPSVGAGNVLSDLMNSGVVNVAELTQVHRQAAGSFIIRAADAVNSGNVKAIQAGHDLEILVPRCPDEVGPDDWSPSNALADMTLDWVTRILPERGYDTKDIQVITAGKSAPSGTRNLNTLLREVMTPDSGQTISGFGETYRAGDRILVTKNNYDLGIFNGMTGDVVMVSSTEMHAVIEGRHVAIPKKALGSISLGYALTCHKMQGSQSKCVVLVVDTAHWMLLERNWLYTAITRASRHLVILAAPKAVTTAVKKTSAKKRKTMLLHHLKQAA